MQVTWKNKVVPVWERTPFLRLLLPFVAGILAYDHDALHWIVAQPLWWSLAMLFTVTALAFLFFRHEGLTKDKLLAILLWFIAPLLGGFAATSFRDIRNDPQCFGHNKSKWCRVQVQEEPAARGQTWRVPVMVNGAYGPAGFRSTTGNAIIYLPRRKFTLPIHRGDTLLVPARWRPITNAGNPFEFDYAGYCRHHNLFLRQYCMLRDIRIAGRCTPAGTPFPQRLHDAAMTRIRAALPDTVAGTLVVAMILGDESLLDEGLLRAWSQAGIVHVIAISGGNVLIFLWVISGLFFWIRNRRYAWIRFVLSLPLVWLYVIVAGGSPSAIRAAIMFTCYVLTVVLRQGSNPLNQWSCTAFLMLLYEPGWLYSVGFVLSFAAVLSLILFYRRIYAVYSPKHKIPRLIWETLAASMAAEILVAPVVVYWFHNFPILFLVANVAALALMGFVQIAGMALAIVGPFPYVGTWLGAVTTWIIHLFNAFINCLNLFEPAACSRLRLSFTELILVYIIIACIATAILRKRRKSFVLALAGCCSLLTLFCIDTWNAYTQQRIIFYHAGNNTLVELINGLNASLPASDSAAFAKADYVTLPAHIGWGVTNEATVKDRRKFYPDTILLLGHHRIFLCHDPSLYQEPFPVDVLCITGPAPTDLRHADSLFAPRLIVLRKRPGLRKVDTPGNATYTPHAHCYCIDEQGAWIASP
jgi:competence protein ComEC